MDWWSCLWLLGGFGGFGGLDVTLTHANRYVA